jgi:hypothetical protein
VSFTFITPEVVSDPVTYLWPYSTKSQHSYIVYGLRVTTVIMSKLYILEFLCCGAELLLLSFSGIILIFIFIRRFIVLGVILLPENIGQWVR